MSRMYNMGHISDVSGIIKVHPNAPPLDWHETTSFMKDGDWHARSLKGNLWFSKEESPKTKVVNVVVYPKKIRNGENECSVICRSNRSEWGGRGNDTDQNKQNYEIIIWSHKYSTNHKRI